MELDRFINTALCSIFTGVRDANQALSKQTGNSSPCFALYDGERVSKGNGFKGSKVKFKIGITVEDSDETKIGGGLKVFSGNLQSSEKEQTVTYVEFEIPVLKDANGIMKNDM